MCGGQQGSLISREKDFVDGQMATLLFALAIFVFSDVSRIRQLAIDDRALAHGLA